MIWRVFYSYSHQDAGLRQRLGVHLAPLRQNKKICEWYDRMIEPGTPWNAEINNRLDSAHLILLLLSADFLDSDYCFGVEVKTAMERLRRGEVKVLPVLLTPCLWQQSRFSELQILPRDAKPITLTRSPEEAFLEVAQEIDMLVSGPLPAPEESPAALSAARPFDSSLDLVREQIRSYASLYERTRQRLRPSDERTVRMEEIFQKMRAIATASYPLLDELAASPSPGERLAAVSILQRFAAERWLPFLVEVVASDKPFSGYHAAKALRFAVGAVDSTIYPLLSQALRAANSGLEKACKGFDTDRHLELHSAQSELEETMKALEAPAEKYD